MMLSPLFLYHSSLYLLQQNLQKDKEVLLVQVFIPQTEDS